MTASPFRSTAAFATRTRNSAPAVERATFVTFTVDGRRFAAPVETVERVLPPPGSLRSTHVPYGGVDVPLVDLAGSLGLAVHLSDTSRVLILKFPSGWLAALVDEVHDVAIVDAAMISLAGRDTNGSGVRTTNDGLPAGVQGLFLQRDQETLVLDVGRVLGFRFS